MRQGFVAPEYVPKHQADAVLSQNNPVSTTYYTVLATKRNVRIISVNASLAFAAGAPTLLAVKVTIDGNVIIFNQSNPANGQNYIGFLEAYNVEASQLMYAAGGNYSDVFKSFVLEGRSVKIEATCTWAANQPTPLACRVKWDKW